MSHKHLSFEERIIIEEGLNKGINIHQIALKLGRSDSSIAREIQRNRSLVYTPSGSFCNGHMGDGTFVCVKRFTQEECLYEGEHRCYRDFCRGCNIMCNKENCPDFEQFICKKLLNAPYVCNGCEDSHYCKLFSSPRYKYFSRKADIEF